MLENVPAKLKAAAITAATTSLIGAHPIAVIGATAFAHMIGKTVDEHKADTEAKLQAAKEHKQRKLDSDFQKYI